ncbi:uncharacterized protein JCM15063_004403 [Sporobolomyces koalae]|uniref:uncharacterized protein n=1 Tax=Sporobolomyces koalae TaxID=500713 RepID=UPI00316CADC5
MANASNEMTEHAEKQEPTYKPSEHDGLKKDGTPDKRMSSEHGFGGDDGPNPHEAGKKGGKVGQEQMAYE